MAINKVSSIESEYIHNLELAFFNNVIITTTTTIPFLIELTFTFLPKLFIPYESKSVCGRKKVGKKETLGIIQQFKLVKILHRTPALNLVMGFEQPNQNWEIHEM